MLKDLFSRPTLSFLDIKATSVRRFLFNFLIPHPHHRRYGHQRHATGIIFTPPNPTPIKIMSSTSETSTSSASSGESSAHTPPASHNSVVGSEFGDSSGTSDSSTQPREPAHMLQKWKTVRNSGDVYVPGLTRAEPLITPDSATRDASASSAAVSETHTTTPVMLETWETMHPSRDAYVPGVTPRST